MTLQEYKLVLQQPGTITSAQSVALQLVIMKYPFLQSAYAIRLKGLYNENSYQYNHTLKLAAAYTTDRTVLFDFITSEEFQKASNVVVAQEEIENSTPHIEIVAPSETDKIPSLEKSILGSIINSQIASEVLEDSVEISEEEEIPSLEQSILDSIEQAEIENDDKESDSLPIDPISAEDNFAEAEENVILKTENSQVQEISVEEELGTPLEFSSTETHSFKEWLQLAKVQPIIREELVAEKVELTENELDKIKKLDLIDKFIEASPKIPPVKSDTRIPVIRDSSGDTSALMTETLARVYLEQKKYQKAIQAYQILILKYPEKSSFFADRISDIKKIQQNN